MVTRQMLGLPPRRTYAPDLATPLHTLRSAAAHEAERAQRMHDEAMQPERLRRAA